MAGEDTQGSSTISFQNRSLAPICIWDMFGCNLLILLYGCTSEARPVSIDEARYLVVIDQHVRATEFETRQPSSTRQQKADVRSRNPEARRFKGNWSTLPLGDYFIAQLKSFALECNLCAILGSFLQLRWSNQHVTYTSKSYTIFTSHSVKGKIKQANLNELY